MTGQLDYLGEPYPTNVHRLEFTGKSAWGSQGDVKFWPANERAEIRNNSPFCQWVSENVGTIKAPRPHVLPQGDQWFVTVNGLGTGVYYLNVQRELPSEVITEFMLRFA